MNADRPISRRAIAPVPACCEQALTVAIAKTAKTTVAIAKTAITTVAIAKTAKTNVVIVETGKSTGAIAQRLICGGSNGNL